MTDERKQRDERLHCNACGQETKHDVICEHRQHSSEPVDTGNPMDDFSVSWDTTYTMLECRGCENVTLRRTYVFSEWNAGEAQIEYFPPHLFRKKPDWADELPKDEQSVLTEVYAALASDSRRLALMGDRTLVDLFIVRKIGDQGTFVEKLKKLEQAGFLSAKNSELLGAALNAGHAAAHRAYLPQREQLWTVMDIVENLLQSDLLAKQTKELRRNTPQRKRRAPAKPKPTKPATP
ncbi:MAG TPA: DUF4145 domain-containing protein [Gemmatimonadales bacterium]